VFAARLFQIMLCRASTLQGRECSYRHDQLSCGVGVCDASGPMRYCEKACDAFEFALGGVQCAAVRKCSVVGTSKPFVEAMDPHDKDVVKACKSASEDPEGPPDAGTALIHVENFSYWPHVIQGRVIPVPDFFQESGRAFGSRWRPSIFSDGFVEAAQVCFSLIDINDVVCAEKFGRICSDRGLVPAETPVQRALDDMKETKWLITLCPENCEWRRCTFEVSQRWWALFILVRLSSSVIAP